MESDAVVPMPVTTRRTVVPIALGTLLIATLAPLAAADHPENEGCAVTPGGWGAPPAGNNPGKILSDHFDEVFGAQLVVGNLVFDDAEEVETTLPYGGQGGAFKNHAVALAINIAFGDAGLLDGTVSDRTATSANATLDGKTATEILAMAEDILNTDSNIRNNEYSDLVEAMTGFNEETFGCHEEPPCPTLVTAVPQADGSIHVAWNSVAGAESYRVYRATGDGDFVFLAETTETTYHDMTTAVGQTYRYMVTAFDGLLESEDCPAVTATAIPYFGGLVTGALALGGSIGAFAWMRRRRA